MLIESLVRRSQIREITMRATRLIEIEYSLNDTSLLFFEPLHWSHCSKKCDEEFFSRNFSKNTYLQRTLVKSTFFGRLHLADRAPKTERRPLSMRNPTARQ
jgi:hypothetical protein